MSYVRGNFFYGRDFLGDGDVDAQCARWLDETANVRIHGTTKEPPRERFERDERAALKPLAVRPYRPLVFPARRFEMPAENHRPLRTPVEVERRDLVEYAGLAEGSPFVVDPEDDSCSGLLEVG